MIMVIIMMKMMMMMKNANYASYSYILKSIDSNFA